MIPPVRILVVDDSAFMRNTISTMLMKYSDMQVVATAQNGIEAIECVRRIQPDVMTLDIDMPGMNGLEVLDYVMAHHPLPVIMISAISQEGAWVTLQALERGAVDFIPKNLRQGLMDVHLLEETLHHKIQDAFQARVKVHQVRPEDSCSSSPQVSPDKQTETGAFSHRYGRYRERASTACPPQVFNKFPVVVIGSSTGGPNLLNALVQGFPAPFSAALIIIQHMPKFFTTVFSTRLNAVASFPIREACHGDMLEPETGFVAPGDQHLSMTCLADGRTVLNISIEPAHLSYRPSIDCAMISAARNFGSLVVGVVLSGMGTDGVLGCQHIKDHGGVVLAQNTETALMAGMPQAVIKAKLANAVVSDGQLVGSIVEAIIKIEMEQGLLIPGSHRGFQRPEEA